MSIGMMAEFPLTYSPWIPMQSTLHEPLKKRSLLLDVYRGTAVLLMIVFHFCWDLLNFGFMHYSIYDPFWVAFRSVILTLFLTAVGWSAYLSLTRSKHTRWWKRDAKLFLAAATISLVTYLAVPERWIYFGILHFILIASLLVRPLARRPILCALIGASIIIVYHTSSWLHFPNAFSIINQYVHLPQRTLDIVFPFPWIGVVFIGPLLGYLNWHRYPVPQHFFIDIIALMGRYALPIYLLHQVFLFSLVAAFNMVLMWLS